VNDLRVAGVLVIGALAGLWANNRGKSQLLLSVVSMYSKRRSRVLGCLTPSLSPFEVPLFVEGLLSDILTNQPMPYLLEKMLSKHASRGEELRMEEKNEKSIVAVSDVCTSGSACSGWGWREPGKPTEVCRILYTPLASHPRRLSP
jgi:hypothetical protein